LIIEKPRCLLLGSIDAPHAAGSLSVREGEAVCSSVASSLFPGLSSKACILCCAVTSRHILVNIYSCCVTHGEGTGVRGEGGGEGGKGGRGGGAERLMTQTLLSRT
jgi:hypothetical protein